MAAAVRGEHTHEQPAASASTLHNAVAKSPNPAHVHRDLEVLPEASQEPVSEHLKGPRLRYVQQGAQPAAATKPVLEDVLQPQPESRKKKPHQRKRREEKVNSTNTY